MSKEVWSDIRVAAFSTIFNSFAVWLSTRAWSVVALLLTLFIAGSLAWYLLKPRSPEQKETANRKPGKRIVPSSSTPGSLVRLAAGIVAIGIALFAGWSSLERFGVQRLEHRLSWRAREFWRAQCLGMKTVQITGVPATHILQYAPNMSNLPREAQLGERRQAIYELQQQGIIRADIPPEKVPGGVIVQQTETTNRGRDLCSYYLNAYTAPKVGPVAEKAQ